MKTTELFKDKTDCCGCGACEAVCKAGAITMREDEYGALYPQLDENACLHCGQCAARCGYRHAVRFETLETYAAVSTTEAPKASSSGGVVASVAASFVEQGGIVYGCAMQRINGELTPRHIRVQDAADLPLLKGSKYVQSDLRDCFAPLKKDLQAGRSVLFIGTPCQVAAVKAYAGKDSAPLYTIELICHGVPTRKLFHLFTRHLETAHGGKLTELQFRHKTETGERCAKLTFARQSVDGDSFEVCYSPEELSYYQLFLDGALQRENCYSCPFAGKKRVGDLTAGDYWGIAYTHPELLKPNGGELDEREGISCLLVNTERGNVLLERCGGGVKRFPSSYENAARYNGQLTRPTERPKERETVFRLLSKRGFEALDSRYRNRLRRQRVFRKVRAAGKRLLRR